MKKQSIIIEKRSYSISGEQYKLYLIPETYNDNTEVLSVYIQKAGYALMTYIIGLPLAITSPLEIQNFIDTNLMHFIEEAEDDIYMYEQAHVDADNYFDTVEVF